MMNEILYRSPFNQMKAPEKLMLMKELAARYLSLIHISEPTRPY